MAKFAGILFCPLFPFFLQTQTSNKKARPLWGLFWFWSLYRKEMKRKIETSVVLVLLGQNHLHYCLQNFLLLQHLLIGTSSGIAVIRRWAVDWQRHDCHYFRQNYPLPYFLLVFVRCLLFSKKRA